MFSICFLQNFSSWKKIGTFLGFVFIFVWVNESVSEKLTNETIFFQEEEEKPFEPFSPEIVKNLPSDINAQILYFIKYYTQGKGKKSLEIWFERAGLYLPYIKKIFKEFSIPEDVAYLFIIESGGNPFARSPAGAMGIWQFMKGTAKRYGLKINFWIDERRDFIKATYAAAKYLSDLYKLFGDWKTAIASYNVGEGRILRLMKIRNFANYWQMMTSGLLPFETTVYLPQWMAVVTIAKNPEKYGFKPIKNNPILFDVIKVKGGLDLRVIAMAGGIDPGLLYLLNAKYRKGITPPGKISEVRIPLNKVEIVKKNLPLMPVVRVKRYFYGRRCTYLTLPHLVNESPLVLYKLAKKVKITENYLNKEGIL